MINTQDVHIVQPKPVVFRVHEAVLHTVIAMFYSDERVVLVAALVHIPAAIEKGIEHGVIVRCLVLRCR
jgi:hypothetical protein